MSEGDPRTTQRWHLEIFLEKQFGESDVKPCFADNPDVIIEADGKCIGIEHTQVFVEHNGPSGLAPIAQEALQDKIIQKAWDLHKERGGPSLNLLVAFTDKTAFYGKDVDRIAGELAASVERLLAEDLRENAWYLVEAWREKRQGRPLPDGIRHLHLEIVTNPGFELWGPPRGGGVPELQIQRIQSVIKAST